MKKQFYLRGLCLALLLVCCLCLAACGKTDSAPQPAAPAAPTPEPTPSPVRFSAGEVAYASQTLRMPLASGETALLDTLPYLQSADLTGSANEEEVARWAAAHPQVQTRYSVTLPNGTVLDTDTESVDLSSATAAEAEAAAYKLAMLPGLKSINLGAEGGGFTWSDIARLRQILPETVFKYAFKLYGVDCNLSDTTINLFRVSVPDDGRLVDEVMGYMPQLTYVDMDGCGLQPKRLEEINLNHPNAKVVFRVFFGDNYTARTDAERILASMASRGGMLNNDNVPGLYYCHDVKYLDLGHNTSLSNIGFVAQMPKLEVAILSMCNIPDASPLASCTNLEYLEIANTYISDLRPLSGLTNLRHLNVAGIGYDQPYDGSERIQLKDITPLLADNQGLSAAVDDIANHFMKAGVTKVLGAEARGFLVGAPVAYKLGVGFVPARKPGKLPRDVYTEKYSLEYGTDVLQIHKDAISPNDRVLIVDDLVATAGTAIASAKLIERAGAELVGFSFVMELCFLNPRETIGKEFDQEIYTLVKVD